jgi:hypothetical protein
MKNALLAASVFVFCSVLFLAAEGPGRITFDDMTQEKPPQGFRFGLTGKGAPGTWVVREKALAQISTDPTDSRFPIAAYEGGSWRDLSLSVRFKALSGKVDQAGGLIFRAKGDNDYYLVRSNALEDNTRLYHVMGGKRKQIAGKDMKVTSNEWHELGVEAVGSSFVVKFDGEKVIEATDDTLKDAGQVGVWTKADSVTLFDDLTIQPIIKEASVQRNEREKSTRWITREKAKVDRIACPWLIKRFIDPKAEFFFVPADKVMSEAVRLGAIPFDMKGVDLGHKGGECTFESILKKYGLDRDPALKLLGKIVNGADTDNSLWQQPEGPGLNAIAEGFRYLGLQDDHAVIRAESIVYDALYAYCREMIRRGKPNGAFKE